MINNKIIRRCLILFLLLFGITSVHLFAAVPDTLRLLVIGNSFSDNATQYLSKFAQERRHHLIIGRAELGGCSLKRHWGLVELAEKNPNDPKAKPYNNKSLKMILTEEKWDVVTLQQNSMNSGYVESYIPYAFELYQFIKTLQPEARVVLHQTWSYRSDSKDFSLITENDSAKTHNEMWEKSREAYHHVARMLNVKIIPVGDAFHKVSVDKKWAYKVDEKYEFSTSKYPQLPDQTHSLHRGYYWDKNEKLIFDSHHANEAGCYLGGLVWFSFLFDESPTKIKFVPDEIPVTFARYLKQVAKSVMKVENQQQLIH